MWYYEATFENLYPSMCKKTKTLSRVVHLVLKIFENLYFQRVKIYSFGIST